MASSSFRLLCSPEELVQFVDTLRARGSLSALVFVTLDSDGVIVTPGHLLPRPFYRAFLFPAGADPASVKWADQKPRPWGWIDLSAGALTPQADGSVHLHLSVFNASDPESGVTHAVKHVNWLKRSLKSAATVRWGVEGENPVIGGRASYKDIGYTKGALRLFREGITWKDNIPTRIIFRPLP